jgi:hypothetical protein
VEGRALLARIDAALAAGHVLPPAVDYAAIQSAIPPPDPNLLSEELVRLWEDAYFDSTADDVEIVRFSDGANWYLFDLIPERVVAAWGESRPAEEERDRSRQAGFIPRFSRHYEGKDRGHFLSHGQGGGMDVNFFPQLKEVNRGWSDAGKLYRAMETYAASHPGTPCFSRPLYAEGNDTWDPEQVEYGVLVGGVTLRAVVFPNR